MAIKYFGGGWVKNLVETLFSWFSKIWDRKVTVWKYFIGVLGQHLFEFFEGRGYT